MGTSNKFTKQTPLVGAPVAAVVAERVYVAPADTVYADPTAKFDGTDPAAPWVDLGIIADSKVNLAVSKSIQYIETGLEKVKRGSYINGKNAEISFSCEQYSTKVLESLTGKTGVAVGVIGKKIQIGQEGVIDRALLFVGTNVADGSEFQHYSKKAGLVFSVEESGDKRVLKVTGTCYPFIASGETEEGLMTVYQLD